MGMIFSQITFAKALKLEKYPPESWKQIEEDLGDINNNLNDAQCGGWNFDEGVADKIPTVTGVPGRISSPLAHPELGMGKRDETDGLLGDGFVFPKTEYSWGWTSACRTSWPKPTNMRPPYYKKNLPCKNPEDCANTCALINRWQYPKWECLEEQEDGAMKIKSRPEGDCVQRGGKKQANTPYLDENANPTKPKNVQCDEWNFIGWYYCCTDALVTKTQYEQCNENNSKACLDHPDANRNCLRCAGDGAASPTDPTKDFNKEELTRSAKRNETGCRVGRGIDEVGLKEPDIMAGVQPREIQTRQYISFFRQYLASFKRAPVPPVENDEMIREDMTVNCFGLYDEYDPKTKKTVKRDRHCVIDHSFKDMEEKQEGKGTYLAEYPDPVIRPERDKKGDLWDTDLGNGISFSAEDVNDLTTHLLTPDTAHHRASVQMTDEKPMSEGSLMRAFDDTVAFDKPDPEKAMNPKRTIVEWWQEQQTEANELFTPPVVRLMLPPTWSFDLDPLQPILTPPKADKWRDNPLMQPIEVQLEVREDLLGEVAEYLKDSLLLQVQEEKIPIVVPLGSATELRGLAEGWCHWHRFNNGTPCSEAQGKTAELIKKLREYANQIDDYRDLRAELSTTLAKYMEVQNGMFIHIGQWVVDNAEQFDIYYQQVDRINGLKPEWENVQMAYRKFHDETNMPWCKNDRFTTPIYSLLDPWMEGAGGERLLLKGEHFPVLIPKKPEGEEDEEEWKDMIFDLTHISVASGGIRIPVLEPVQLSVDYSTLRPPVETEENAEIPTLKDLPEIPSITKDMDEELSKFSVKDAPKIIEIPELNIDFNEIEKNMKAIEKLITEMDEAYKKFWGIGVLNKKNLNADCTAVDTGRCVHVEMDLLERFTRIGARPGVYLKEDFDSKGKFRPPDDPKNCPTEDWSCQKLNPEYIYPRRGWHVLVSAERQKDFINNLRKKLFEDTILSNLNFKSDRKDILPSLNSPTEILLYLLQ